MDESVKAKILIVEDSQTQAKLLERILTGCGYNSVIASNYDEAVSAIKIQVPDIIFSDIVMPGLDGYDLCKTIKEDKNLKNIQIVLLTSLNEPIDIINGLKSGADGFILKPITEDKITSCLDNILNNLSIQKRKLPEMGLEIFWDGEYHFLSGERLNIVDVIFKTVEKTLQKNIELKELNKELMEISSNLDKEKNKLKKMADAIIRLTSKIIGVIDPYTEEHQARVCKLAVAIAKKLNISKEKIELIDLAAKIHDIGKIIIPMDILCKPAKLTVIEYELVKMHPVKGKEILGEIDFQKDLDRIVYQHHERINGSGYPEGMDGSSIIFEAKIIAAADVVEAMLSHRPYRPAHTIDEVIDELKTNSGVLYDSGVVDICIDLLKNEKLFF